MPKRAADPSRFSGQKMPGSQREMLAEMKSKATIQAALVSCRE